MREKREPITKRHIARLHLLVLSLLLAACAGSPPPPYQGQADGFDAAFASWKGVPYRYGGTGRNGVDCSAFVQILYRDVLGYSLPRTTLAQSEVGVRVPQDQLARGDLLFFLIGDKQRHTGIYLGNGVFIHASSSQGVMRSRLDAPYWEQRLWQARRVSLIQ